MKRRALIAALTLLFAADAAHASGGEAKPAEVGQYVNLQPIALPIVAGGTVVNYVFVMIRIDLSSAANSNALRAKEPYFRDALVRAAHRAPFNSNKDYLSVDEAKLKAQVMRDAVAIAGARNIKGVTLISQTAKRHSGVPKYRGA
jgi:flagellar basal body-associated protein FliL